MAETAFPNPNATPRVNLQRVYWLTFGWFGLMAITNGAVGLQDDGLLGSGVVIGAGLVILIAGVWGALHPEDSGAPAEAGWLLSLGIVAAGLYTIVTIFRFI